MGNSRAMNSPPPRCPTSARENSKSFIMCILERVLSRERSPLNGGKLPRPPVFNEGDVFSGIGRFLLSCPIQEGY